ncbi:hypothetical protein P167DRAFT_535883 [Morchella conica CCBAS932]|uniref:Uncharacterized protein n=1 Tax=Morchella conica CCBAS932 TaxID=1392247 RepID=A0A3N4KPX7_9PEZI|nr:hypothetical protein P167DRAFT_535883 [Morchella conica CCBAS932]
MMYLYTNNPTLAGLMTIERKSALMIRKILVSVQLVVVLCLICRYACLEEDGTDDGGMRRRTRSRRKLRVRWVGEKKPMIRD